MKNKEVLIQLLIELRSNGICNSDVLNIIEKNPPNYFFNSLGYKFYSNKNTFQDIVNIVKVINICFFYNKTIQNIFISDFNKGWLLLLASKISKRVYSLCKNINQKKKLESFLENKNIKNIYLKIGDNVKDWCTVAPFDILVFTNQDKLFDVEVLEYLENDGFILLPRIKKETCKFIRLDNLLKEYNTNINLSLLLNSNII